MVLQRVGIEDYKIVEGTYRAENGFRLYVYFDREVEGLFESSSSRKALMSALVCDDDGKIISPECPSRYDNRISLWYPRKEDAEQAYSRLEQITRKPT